MGLWIWRDCTLFCRPPRLCTYCTVPASLCIALLDEGPVKGTRNIHWEFWWVGGALPKLCTKHFQHDQYVHFFKKWVNSKKQQQGNRGPTYIKILIEWVTLRDYKCFNFNKPSVYLIKLDYVFDVFVCVFWGGTIVFVDPLAHSVYFVSVI